MINRDWKLLRKTAIKKDLNRIKKTKKKAQVLSSYKNNKLKAQKICF